MKARGQWCTVRDESRAGDVHSGDGLRARRRPRAERAAGRRSRIRTRNPGGICLHRARGLIGFHRPDDCSLSWRVAHRVHRLRHSHSRLGGSGLEKLTGCLTQDRRFSPTGSVTLCCWRGVAVPLRLAFALADDALNTQRRGRVFTARLYYAPSIGRQRGRRAHVAAGVRDPGRRERRARSWRAAVSWSRSSRSRDLT